MMKNFISNLEKGDWVDVTICDSGCYIGKVKNITENGLDLENSVQYDSCYPTQTSAYETICDDTVEISLDDDLFEIKASSEEEKNERDFFQISLKKNALCDFLGKTGSEVKMQAIDIRPREYSWYESYFMYHEQDNTRTYVLTEDEKKDFDHFLQNVDEFRLACKDDNLKPYIDYNKDECIQENGLYFIKVKAA